MERGHQRLALFSAIGLWLVPCCPRMGVADCVQVASPHCVLMSINKLLLNDSWGRGMYFAYSDQKISMLEMFVKKLNALVRMVIDGDIMEHVLVGVVVIVLVVTLVGPDRSRSPNVPVCKPRGARGWCFHLPGVPPPTLYSRCLHACRRDWRSTMSGIATQLLVGA
ncbi:protein of unknown function (plasmid) [Cupriavidus taiwanensis]|uniref:Uncharacterized protein n=1 Tax=Cupriavidus taiwanensis TaxID=164546 RepID=A0A375FJN2_9BURK|nr:protein of unknown function [Cupriavidus taiwanensis]SOZ72431.1 protein of unknown function [Cupriavidus taiwanensis]SOZ74820.1 protein of unknown function [Cupriavidus taiwanensis]SPA03635.1 protein of unknown function [Cupriavidus taiwanensis]SPA11532.1 protein of unknown function [Cupriavidus taiwanensis]